MAVAMILPAWKNFQIKKFCLPVKTSCPPVENVNELAVGWIVWARALAGGIVLCSWARHFTLTVPLSTQAYKWVPANCWRNLTNCWEVTCDGLASRPGEVEILLAASCYRNRDKHRQLWASLGSKASLHFLPRYHVDTSRIAQLCLKRPQLQ